MPESKGRPKPKSSYTPPARAKAPQPNPEWWVPVFVTLLLVGLIWIVVFYVTQGVWPVQKFGTWNLVVGFALLLSGFVMAMRWR